MTYEIIFAEEALEAYHALSAYRRAVVREMIDVCLKHEPTRVSKSRIKRLKGVTRAEYRLRVGSIRVFYLGCGHRVTVLGIMEKRYADDWLKKGEER